MKTKYLVSGMFLWCLVMGTYNNAFATTYASCAIRSCDASTAKPYGGWSNNIHGCTKYDSYCINYGSGTYYDTIEYSCQECSSDFYKRVSAGTVSSGQNYPLIKLGASSSVDGCTSTRSLSKYTCQCDSTKCKDSTTTDTTKHLVKTVKRSCSQTGQYSSQCTESVSYKCESGYMFMGPITESTTCLKYCSTGEYPNDAGTCVPCPAGINTLMVHPVNLPRMARRLQ